ncbi:MAG: rhomboid family intramembrane serine protease [Chloroherpetonaceae bacterium]
MKITYNAPVVLTFTFLCVGVMVVSSITGGWFAKTFCATMPNQSWLNPLTYLRLFSHILGHADWTHLLSNFSFILLLGGLLEEKYGSESLLIQILITAFVTAILNNIFFSTGLMGASGVVFMMILLSSFVNFRQGEIPLTFILVVLLYLGREVISSFEQNNISEFAHILGGICGAVFGFFRPFQNT